MQNLQVNLQFKIDKIVIKHTDEIDVLIKNLPKMKERNMQKKEKNF